MWLSYRALPFVDHPDDVLMGVYVLLELVAPACLAVGFFILLMRHRDRALTKELEASDVRDDWRQRGRSTSVS